MILGVTASAQKSLGPELLDNPNFDTDPTDWADYFTITSRGTTTWSSGVTTLTNDQADSAPFISQAKNIVSGKVYKLSVEITGISASTTARLVVLGNVPTVDDTRTDIGMLNVTFTASDTNASWALYIDEVGNTGHYISFDNASFKEIL